MNLLALLRTSQGYPPEARTVVTAAPGRIAGAPSGEGAALGDDRGQQLQKGRVHERENDLRLGITEAAVELDDPEPLLG